VLDLYCVGVEKPFFQFKTPKHASSKPISVNVWDTESETGIELSLYLLGDGILELHDLRYPIIPDMFQLIEYVVLVGVQSKTQDELDQELEV
jgi:hypothetical protein